MSSIRLETWIDAPPQTCFDLCLDVDVHLNVPGAKERAVAGVTSGVMTLGDHVTWRSTRMVIPTRMTSLITEVAKPSRFVDEMQRGPFARWKHTHRFECSGGGTRMIDEIEYRAPLGPLGWIADKLFVRRYMTKLLLDQNAHIKRLAETQSP